MAYENILTETRDRVALVTLNRPQRLNALSDALADELGEALRGYDADPGISVIVITERNKPAPFRSSHAIRPGACGRRLGSSIETILVSSRYKRHVMSAPSGRSVHGRSAISSRRVPASA